VSSIANFRSSWPRTLRTVAWLAISGVLVCVIVFAIGGRSWIAHAIAVAPNAGKVIRKEEDPLAAEVRRAGADAQLRVELPAPDRVSLCCWIAEPREPPKGTVLVLHGIRSDKFWMMGLARRISEAGFLAVVPDLRGHGRSTGDWLSYGVRESQDLSRLLSELARLKRLVEPVGVVGVSYGAATGIQLAARDSRVRAVVAIAPFQSLEAVVPSYVQHYLPIFGHFVPRRLISESVAQAGALAGFDPKAADAETAISHTRAKVLLIHGTRDDHIPAEHSRHLHAAAPDHSELVLVEGADHFSIASDPTVTARAVDWLLRWLAR
jgi:pimeloyl-ACP methyl ester carboxylesterase